MKIIIVIIIVIIILLFIIMIIIKTIKIIIAMINIETFFFSDSFYLPSYNSLFRPLKLSKKQFKVQYIFSTGCTKKIVIIFYILHLLLGRKYSLRPDKKDFGVRLSVHHTNATLNNMGSLLKVVFGYSMQRL